MRDRSALNDLDHELEIDDLLIGVRYVDHFPQIQLVATKQAKKG